MRIHSSVQIYVNGCRFLPNCCSSISLLLSSSFLTGRWGLGGDESSRFEGITPGFSGLLLALEHFRLSSVMQKTSKVVNFLRRHVKLSVCLCRLCLSCKIVIVTSDCDWQWPFQVLFAFHCWYEASLCCLDWDELLQLQTLCENIKIYVIEK